MTEHYKGQFEPAKNRMLHGDLVIGFNGNWYRWDRLDAIDDNYVNIDQDHYKLNNLDLMVIMVYSK